MALYALLALALASAQAPPRGLDSVIRFDDLYLLPEVGTRCYQASSYSRENVNADAGNFLRIEPDGEQVMMEAEGPGIIYRIWTTGVTRPNLPVQDDPNCRFLIYLDGETKPTIDMSVAELFGIKGKKPFAPPLSRSFESGRGAWEGHASICYMPIPFAKSVKVTGRNTSFYHVDWISYPKDTPIQTLKLPLTVEQQNQWDRAAKVLNDAAEGPYGWSGATSNEALWLGGKTYRKRMEPGETYRAEYGGPGILRGLRAHLPDKSPTALRGLTLRIWWDGNDSPSVQTPIGDFFGSGMEARRFSSLPLAMLDDFLCSFPMPFREKAIIEVTNDAPRPVEFGGIDVAVESVADLPDNAGYFHAMWRRDPDIADRVDYNILTAEGRGKFVGCNITMQSAPRAGGIFFLEGDEKIYVDGEKWPVGYFGTGTEDYFNGAYFWNAVKYEHGPYSGLTFIDWGVKRVCAYRWHLTDWIPFYHDISVNIEHGPVSDHPSDYASVAYWYQEKPHTPYPPLPDFADRLQVSTPPMPTTAPGAFKVEGPLANGTPVQPEPWSDLDPAYSGEGLTRIKGPDAAKGLTYVVHSPGDGGYVLTADPMLPGEAELLVDGKVVPTKQELYKTQGLYSTLRTGEVRLSEGKHEVTVRPRTGADTFGCMGIAIRSSSPNIKVWRVVGPFPNENHSGFDKDFGPEKKIDLAAEYDGIGGKVGWKKVYAADGRVTPANGGDWRIAYGITYVYSARAMDTTFLLGKDDGMKMWLNGKLIYNENTWSHNFPDSFSARGKLKRGWNTILVKVANHGGAWGWCVRPIAPPGTLRYSDTKG